MQKLANPCPVLVTFRANLWVQDELTELVVRIRFGSKLKTYKLKMKNVQEKVQNLTNPYPVLATYRADFMSSR